MTPCPKEVAQAKTIAIVTNDAFILFEQYIIFNLLSNIYFAFNFRV